MKVFCEELISSKLQTWDLARILGVCHRSISVAFWLFKTVARGLDQEKYSYGQDNLNCDDYHLWQWILLLSYKRGKTYQDSRDKVQYSEARRGKQRREDAWVRLVKKSKGGHDSSSTKAHEEKHLHSRILLVNEENLSKTRNCDNQTVWEEEFLDTDTIVEKSGRNGYCKDFGAVCNQSVDLKVARDLF